MLTVKNTIQIEGTEIPTTIKTVVSSFLEISILLLFKFKFRWATGVAHTTTRVTHFITWPMQGKQIMAA